MDPSPFISGYVVGHFWIRQDIIKELLRGIAYFHCLKQIYMQVGHARRFPRCIVRRGVCIAKPSKLRLLSLPQCLPASLPVPLCLWLIQGLEGIRTARESLSVCLTAYWYLIPLLHIRTYQKDREAYHFQRQPMVWDSNRREYCRSPVALTYGSQFFLLEPFRENPAPLLCDSNSYSCQ